MRKTAKQQAPTWLNEAVYEPKRQRTFELVKQAVDTLIKQREQDGITRIWDMATIRSRLGHLTEGNGFIGS